MNLDMDRHIHEIAAVCDYVQGLRRSSKRLWLSFDEWNVWYRARDGAATDGRTSVSAQAYALRGKVLDVDAWVRSGAGAQVIEVHPEVSFARMAGGPVLARKKDPDGVRARREALAAHGIVAPPWFRGAGFGEDDLLDACAVAWTAVRHSLGESVSLPAEPEVFSDHIPAAIWV